MKLHDDEWIAHNPYGSVIYRPPFYPHRSTFYKITVFYGGISKMEFYSRKGGKPRIVTMKSGDAFIITPKDVHCFYILDNKDYCFRDVYIFDKEMKSVCDSISKTLFEKINSGEYPPIFSISQNELISYAEIHSLLIYKQRSKDLDSIHKSCVYSLLGRYILYKMNEKKIYPDWLRTLLTLMYQESFIIQSIEDICVATHFSHGYLCRQFKHYMNMTLKQYVIKRKLEYSCNILNSTEDSITDIAIRLNFSTRSNYIKLFKLEYGVTPSKYRSGKAH